jgi:glucosamine--fructose-6-phosphate aminotransferase (isomerizing)
MDEARKKGATLWSIVNAIGSQAMRVADGCISMQVGPEIGVASTKAFTAPILDLYMIAVYLADLRGTLDKKKRLELVKDLLTVPSLVEKALASEKAIKEIASRYKDTKGALYIGRGVNMPIAYEGALKLKEISYIHAEGYPAGEMKHGPIALVDEYLPVIVIATQDPWYDKMISQIEQAKARSGKVLAVATEGDELIPTIADEIFWIPKTPWLLSPAVTIIPLQLFAYHIAAFHGLDVDQPRNLAKSVTVE